MQNPPPGPPRGGQPPSYPPPGGQQPGYQPAATGGVDKKTGTILSYVLGWVTGIVFLFVGKDDPDVKYHAAQSLVFFGGLSVVMMAIWIVSHVLPWYLVALLGLANFALFVFGFVVWIMCLVRASSGGGARFQVPLVGNLVTQYAEQLAAAVS
jgi:uncharacterized membrane protein